MRSTVMTTTIINHLFRYPIEQIQGTAGRRLQSPVVSDHGRYRLRLYSFSSLVDQIYDIPQERKAFYLTTIIPCSALP